MMALGVSYDLYWSGDPYAVRYFIEAFEIAQQRLADECDYRAWLAGGYVREAVGVALAHVLDRNATASYPDEPRSVTQRRKKRVDRETAITSAFAEMEALVRVYNANLRKKSRDGRDQPTEE